MRFCGIDFGTTNTKAVLLNEDAELLAKVTIPIEQSLLTDSFDAMLWLEHFHRVIDHFKSQGVIQNEKVVLSITAQGGSFVVLNRQFEPISPAFSWVGESKQETVDDLIGLIGNDKFYEQTGWNAQTWLMVCKLKEWLSSNEDLRGEIGYVTTVPDFLHAKLSGRVIGDITNAQITGMFDFNTRDWDQNILDWVGCERAWLPEVLDELLIFECDAIIDGVSISFVTSSHDQYAAMQAAGISRAGQFMLATGTAWVLNGQSDEPRRDYVNYSIYPGRDFVSGNYGYIVSFGSIGRGFDDLRNGGADENEIGRYMEEAACRVRDLMEQCRAGGGVDKIIMTGGAAVNGEWAGIIARVCGVAVEAVEFSELTAYGAAMMARKAAGICGEIDWPGSVVVRRFEAK